MEERFEPLVTDLQLNFFISYKWNEISKKEADNICNQLNMFQINPIRDIYKVKPGNSIMSYMDSINNCHGIVIILCNEYFFSINCMYECITAMLNRKNMTIIRLIEQTVITQEFRKTVSKHWNDYEKEELPDYEKEKLRIIKEHYQEFLTWICDTYLVSQEENKQFCKELEKHIEKVFLETGNYLSMMEDLIGSKHIIISKVCDPVCEEYYHYKNINYSIQDSPVDYFKCLYNFTLTLEKYDTNELIEIQINNVVGIQQGCMGLDFSKYYFVIPMQESLDKLAYEEKLGKERSEIKYFMRRIIIHL